MKTWQGDFLEELLSLSPLLYRGSLSWLVYRRLIHPYQVRGSNGSFYRVGVKTILIDWMFNC
jgi:hypothetical protein